MIVPVSLVFILFLLYTTFNSLKNALLVLVTVPFALIGGIFSLVLTGTNFSISAAVGVISTLEVAIPRRSPVNLSYRQFPTKRCPELREAVLKGADVQMRPILMATLAAAIGLLPAALATGIGSHSPKASCARGGGGDADRGGVDPRGASGLYEVVDRRTVSRRPVDAEREAPVPQ